MSGWSPVPLPSCLPSTRPLPGAFFPVSFSAINSGVSLRSGSSREQEEAGPHGRFKQHPPLPGEEAAPSFTLLGRLPQAVCDGAFSPSWYLSTSLPCSLSPPLCLSSSWIRRETAWPIYVSFSHFHTSTGWNADVLSVSTHLQSHLWAPAGGCCWDPSPPLLYGVTYCMT